MGFFWGTADTANKKRYSLYVTKMTPSIRSAALQQTHTAIKVLGETAAAVAAAAAKSPRALPTYPAAPYLWT